jgi:hypothetical protein
MSRKLHDDKKTIRERIKDEFINSFIKYIVWTIPLSIILFLLHSFYDNILFPSLEVSELKVTIEKDRMVFSPDNTALPGKLLKTDDNGEQIMYNYSAPELEISMKGKGKIKAAYVVYEYNEKYLVQEISDLKNSLTGLSINPNKLNVAINYYTDTDEKQMYIVLIGKDNNKNIWCGYINAEKQTAEFRSSRDVFQLMIYESAEDKFSMDKEKLMEDIAAIYNMNL